jgi:hypothetical protein
MRMFKQLEAAPAGTRVVQSDALDALRFTADGLIPPSRSSTTLAKC